MAKRSFDARRMTRDIILGIVILTLAVLALVTYLVLQARRDISEQYINNATARAATEFRAMQETIAGQLGLVRQWGASDTISLSRMEDLKGLLLPLLTQEPMLSGITISDTDGRSYFLLPDGDDRKLIKPEGFDPRLRPWFAPALENDGVYWTEQYRFHTLQEVGITASIAYPLKSGKGNGVVAFDVLLDDLYRTIKGMAPTANSEVFAFRRDELLLIPDSGVAGSGFVPVETATNALARNMHQAWQGKRSDMTEVISFLQSGRIWWCGFQPLEGRQQNVWLGVVVPESDILLEISHRRSLMVGMGLMWILAAAAGVIAVSRRHARKMAAAAAQNIVESEAEVQRLVADGENRFVEFKSTMRMNLHAKKPGKEIEMAWLKGIAAFLNTDGGTLLLGVTDAGEITGLEQDVFENDDKCRLHFKNLIATHIGAEFSKHIRLLLIPVAEKTVGVVHCSRSSEPVFLKNGNKEAFYIRNGPSSDELPVSKALKYIKHRK